jgi:dihydrofolate reductase
VVFTKTLSQSLWDKTILAKGNIVDEILQLKNQQGRDIITYGGASFVSSLIKNRLIDEFHLFINPVAIGKGLTIFDKLDGNQDLSLISSSTFACGIVVLNYKSNEKQTAKT